MRFGWIALWVLGVLLLTGCQAGHEVPTVATPLRVVDGETGAPLKYVAMSYWVDGKQTSYMTDEAGRVTLPVGESWLFQLGIGHRGYLPRTIGRQEGDWMAYEKIVAGDICLYEAPKPRITVTVPAGYRGPVVIDFVWTHGRIQDARGKRDFEYAPDAEGYVRIEATALFRQMDQVEFRFKFAGGSEIREPSGVGYSNCMSVVLEPDKVRVRDPHKTFKWVDKTDERTRREFVIGTDDDVTAYQKARIKHDKEEDGRAK
jgi:hypothetical protein